MSAPAVEKLAYDLDEAAKALGVSRRTIEREVAAGRIASVKLGARRVIPVVALRAHLEAKASS